MKIRSTVIFAVTISCALAACHSPPAAPKRGEPVRLVKAPSNLADLGVTGFVLHPPLTTDAPGLIEFVDANRVITGKMTSSTVRSETSVSTTMTIEGLGDAEPLALTDETVGGGALTRVILRRGAETTTYEHDAAGTFLVGANGKVPVDHGHEADLSAALPLASADPRFRVFITLGGDPQLAEPLEVNQPFNHKSPLCSAVLGTAASGCVSTCLAAATTIPVTLPVCLLVCGIAATDLAYCQYEASHAVNDAQCAANSNPGYIARADAAEHECIQLCDPPRCDSVCKYESNPPARGGYCSGNSCTCWGADDTGDGTSGDDTSADDTSADDTSADGGGSCTGWQTWCDCIGANNEYHGLVCSETPERLIDDCWSSCD